MKYRTLGRTGLRCSEVGLGTWAFASQVYGQVAEKEAHRTIRAAFDAGITFYDTAPLYGTSERDGVAEEILGKGLAGLRDEVVISTKFGRNPTENNAPNFHAKRARESVEASLRRLNTDRIDVLFFHSPFSESDIHDDVWEELDHLKASGKVRAVGHSISMFQDTKEMALRWASEGRIDVVQVVYSLLNREASRLIDQMGGLDVGVVARESLANGFLSGKITADTVFPKGHLNSRYSKDEIAARVQRVAQLGFLVRGEVKSVPQAAMRWVLANDAVSLVLTGASNTQEMLECAVAADFAGYTASELAKAAEVHTSDFEAA